MTNYNCVSKWISDPTTFNIELKHFIAPPTHQKAESPDTSLVDYHQVCLCKRILAYSINNFKLAVTSTCFLQDALLKLVSKLNSAQKMC